MDPTYIRNRPFELTSPDIGLSSAVRSLILSNEISNDQIYGQPRTHSVDFPAPFAPTIAIRESRPTSMFMLFRISFSWLYPNETSFSCNTGGEIFSISGNLVSLSKNAESQSWEMFTNLKVSDSSASGGSSSGSCFTQSGLGDVPLM